LQKLCSKTRVR